MLFDQQRGQANQSDQRGGRQTQPPARTQRRHAERRQMHDQRLIAVQARKHVDRRIVGINQAAQRTSQAGPRCARAKIHTRRIKHKHGRANKCTRKQRRHLLVKHIFYPETGPEHAPRHIKIPQDIKHDKARPKRKPVIERQMHDMIPQAEVLRHEIKR